MAHKVRHTIGQQKLDDLRALLRKGVSPNYGECIAIHWTYNVPDGGTATEVRYYAASRFADAPNYSNWPWNPLEVRLGFEAGGSSEAFLREPEMLAFNHTHDLREDTVSFTLKDDEDLTLTNKMWEAKGAARVEILGYFADVDLPLRLWFGLLNPGYSADGYLLNLSATFGYRNPNTRAPRRLLSSTKCDATARFGGKRKTLPVFPQDCPYAFQFGGIGLADPITGQPYKTCPGTSKEICHARIGGDPERLPYLAFETTESSESIFNSKGPNTLATTKGNDSILNTPLSVIFGERIVRQIPALLSQVEIGSKPEDGSVSAFFAVSDCEVLDITDPKINGQSVTVAPGSTQNQFQRALGQIQQAPVFLTRTRKAPNTSGVAVWRGNIKGNFAGKRTSEFQGECTVRGNVEITRLAGASAGTRGYSTNRAECLKWFLESPRVGAGESGEAYQQEDWVELAERSDDAVKIKDATGAEVMSTRATFNCQLDGRELRQQIVDICTAGRFSVPFFIPEEWQDGVGPKKRMKLLGVVDDDASLTVIRDEGPLLNVDYIRPVPQEIDFDQLVAYFEDAEHNNIRRGLTFDYETLRERRGAAAGDAYPAPRAREIALLGITGFGEAARTAQIAANVGQLDDGGWENPLRVTFGGPWVRPDLFTLHPYAQIKIESRWLAPYKETTSERPFEQFMVLAIKRDTRGYVEVLAQAVPIDYLADAEDPATAPPLDATVIEDGTLPEVDQTDDLAGGESEYVFLNIEVE